MGILGEPDIWLIARFHGKNLESESFMFLDMVKCSDVTDSGWSKGRDRLWMEQGT